MGKVRKGGGVGMKTDESYKALEKKCEMYRRQLGGCEAASRRLRGQVKELKALVMDMWHGMCPDAHGAGACDSCENYAGDGCAFLLRAREMGIDV